MAAASYDRSFRKVSEYQCTKRNNESTVRAIQEMDGIPLTKKQIGDSGLTVVMPRVINNKSQYPPRYDLSKTVQVKKVIEAFFTIKRGKNGDTQV